MDILVFKTSSDTTMFKLLEEIRGNNIDCFIQSSEIKRYADRYNNVNFIDIQGEGFYNISESIYNFISEKIYDEIYITFSGYVGHNYGNIIEILQKIRFRKAYFYNCDGERTCIPKQNVIKDFLCKVFIDVTKKFY